MPSAPDFLRDHELRPWTPDRRLPGTIRGFALGRGNPALQVLVADWPAKPRAEDLRSLWKERTSHRPFPLLAVALYGAERAAVCGVVGEDPPARVDLERAQVERLCRAALGQPNKEAAIRYLGPALEGLDGPAAGIRNEGLFAAHQLLHGVPRRSDWHAAGEKGRAALRFRGRDLLKALGYTIEPLQGPTWVLKASGHEIAVAVFLERGESADLASPAFSELSPVSFALARADERNLPYVIIEHGAGLRIHPTDPTRGVGRRGRTDTFLELQLDLLPDAQAAFLWLLFAAENLERGGAFDQILEDSGRFAGDVGERLRDRIYDRVVPRLAQALWSARGRRTPTAERLAETYEAALLLLFRVLFLAYAEDRDLLPYRTNGLYRKRSIKEIARELLDLERAAREAAARGDAAAPGQGTDCWQRLRQLFTAVREGNRSWGVPAYGGAIFETDAVESPLGAALETVEIPDAEMIPILQSLLLDDTPEGRGPVDFRSLGVREFGTIYEGLLEQELSVAETDLALDKEGRYAPVKGRATVVVRKGEVYLHNASGARKSTGSYYTKSFAVDHLLDHALAPALEEHLQRLDTMDEKAASDEFFRFHVADIAMGSGHFLVAAVDRIEAGLSRYLARRRLPGVADELRRLREAALASLGALAQGVEIEDAQLLRRQIARRCVYGVDVNPKAVMLARLSIWIHTFVPGLPLSFLDRGLVEGNSLVGIATFSEAEKLLTKDETAGVGTLYSLSPEEFLRQSTEPLERLARISEATKAEVEAARRDWLQAQKAVEPARALFDLLAASRLDPVFHSEVMTEFEGRDLLQRLGELPDSPLHRKARKLTRAIPPFHFPVAFPDVFLRKPEGFDVILGNPPWEEATVEEDNFWTRFHPGMQSLPQKEREKLAARLRKTRPDLHALYEEELARAALLRRALVTGPYPGMGTGDPDVYKAFAWRFWRLLAEGRGVMGVVLPRTAFAAKGSAEFRLHVLERGTFRDVTFLLNARSWMFDMEPRYTVALLALRKAASRNPAVPLSGPYPSYEEYASRRVGRVAEATVPVAEIRSWSEGAAFPLLPRSDSLAVFRRLRAQPRLDARVPGSWLVRPHRELDATNDKPLMSFTERDGYWPVFKGESFDLWEPDTGTYYAWADPETLCRHLQEKRLKQRRLERSAFAAFPPEVVEDPATLPCLHPRIAFRDITNRTNTRTCVCALLPGRVFLTNKAPYILFPAGTQSDMAYLLAVMSSRCFDWYARRYAEISMNFYLLNAFPVPRPTPDSALRLRAVSLAGRLAAPDRRFAKWARAVGVECGKLVAEEKEDMIRELDAVVAHLYGLDEPQLVHIFETFHAGWDHETPLRAALKHFHAWARRAR